MDIAALYQEIGNTLHTLGSDRVVLLSSKNSSTAPYEMELEIAIDNYEQKTELDKQAIANWPNVKIVFEDINDESIDEEAITFGIVL